MLSLISFILVTYALCFLAADARIFGADASAWNAVLEDPHPEDRQWLQDLGVFKLRQKFLPVKFFREHLSCYFCMGVWAGPTTHLIFWHLQGKYDYFLHHSSTPLNWAMGLLVAFLLGASSSYILNAVIVDLEGNDN